jgi:hypothetical protein
MRMRVLAAVSCCLAVLAFADPGSARDVQDNEDRHLNYLDSKIQMSPDLTPQQRQTLTLRLKGMKQSSALHRQAAEQGAPPVTTDGDVEECTTCDE